LKRKAKRRDYERARACLGRFGFAIDPKRSGEFLASEMLASLDRDQCYNDKNPFDRLFLRSIAVDAVKQAGPRATVRASILLQRSQRRG
jgi:hypothetical protein